MAYQIVQIYYPCNGKLKEEYQIIDYKKNGLHRCWHKNGISASKTNFVNNKPHGLSTRFDEQGEIEYQAEFNNGLLDGKTIYYYKDKKQRVESQYRDNVLHGFVKVFKEDELVEESLYRDGVLITKSFFTDKDTHKCQKFTKAGNLMSEVTFKNMKKNGKGVYYRSENYRIEIEFKDDLLHGKSRVFIDNKLREEKTFENGVEIRELQSRL